MEKRQVNHLDMWKYKKQLIPEEQDCRGTLSVSE